MGFVDEYIDFTVSSYSKKHEEMGYDIPKSINKKGKLTYDFGKKYKVKISDLSDGSRQKVKYKCDNCDKTLNIVYHDYISHNHDGKYYCNKCSKVLFITGEKNGRWNPTLTKEERFNNRNRNLNPEYNKLIRTVLKRDNYKCIKCGNHAKDVHHLNGWDWAFDQRFETANCVSLCETCHKNFHYVYRYGNNTKEQFEEWSNKPIVLENYETELPTSIHFYCVEDDKIYTVKEFQHQYDIKDPSTIYNVLSEKEIFDKRKNRFYIPRLAYGKHVISLEKYSSMTKSDLDFYVTYYNVNNTKNVISLNYGILFESSKKANFYIGRDGMSYKSINACCTGQQNSFGTSQTGEPLCWIYYDNFIKLSKQEQLNIYNTYSKTFEKGSFLMQFFKEYKKEVILNE